MGRSADGRVDWTEESVYRFFHTSPVDLDNLGEWDELARRLRRCLASSFEGPHRLEIADSPRLAPGADIAEQLADLEELTLSPREARLELWSVHPGYAVVATLLGSGFVRRERRCLLRAYERALDPHPLLAQHEGAWDLDACTAFGFALDPADEVDRVQVRWLVEPLDEPLYMGERWLLQDRSESIDPERYFVGQELGPQRVLFIAESEEAELDAWARAGSGEGLIALDPDDPDMSVFARRFGDGSELETFLVHAVCHALPRVTLGRGPCRPGSPRVMVYDPPGYVPEIDALPVFFV